MGLLIPEGLSLDRLPKKERRVVRMLRSSLRDSWLMIPAVVVAEKKRRTYEIDLVLVNEQLGIVALETKGGPFTIRHGEWYRRGEIVEPSPPKQAEDAAYALRRWLRGESERLADNHVQYALAFPDITEIDGGLPPGVSQDHLFLSGDLADPEDRLFDLLSADHRNRPLEGGLVEEVVGLLRPDVGFRWDPQALNRHARVALHRITADQTRALETLDRNRRVVVAGPAGSGKTRLALAWVERAVQRGEQVLLTCFNEPMAEALGEMAPEHERLTVGSVQNTMRTLEGVPELPVPDDADEDWWATKPFENVVSYLDDVVPRFDTIVVDEAQDFANAWIETLERLFREDGPKRLLRVADSGQLVFDRGFVLPDAGPDLVRADLTVNCRNTRAIADLLRGFGGAKAAPGVPEGELVEFVVCDSEEAAVEAVGRLLEDLVVGQHVDPANILVVTGHRALRDRIRREAPGGFACVAWEGRHGGDIICETVYRIKGLERDAVVLATVRDDLSDHLLYVGMSRAISTLRVVAPEPLLDRIRAKARLRSRAGVADG